MYLGLSTPNGKLGCGNLPSVNKYKSAGWAYIDDVIDPRETRRVLAWGLELAAHKKALRPGKKHGVIPV